MEEIIIEFSPDGEGITFEGKNIIGPDCKKLTEGIEQALGKTQKTVTKPEYRRTQTAKRTVTN